MRAAMLHVIGDVVQSIGVVIAGAVIWARPDWRLADPITTFLFSIVVLFTTWRMLKESVAILMESTPPGVDYVDVLKVLAALPPVSDVHDLHIWSITAGKAAMSVHLIASDAETALGLAQEAMWRDFGIFHCTIQVEHETSDECCHPCGV
jgi:zinc transporter 2